MNYETYITTHHVTYVQAVIVHYVHCSLLVVSLTQSNQNIQVQTMNKTFIYAIKPVGLKKKQR